MLDNLGYSYPAGDEFAIVLHPGSVYGSEIGDLYQTIIHEMSHVYLTQKNHPSHIERTYEEVYDPMAKRFPEKWQTKTIRVAMYYPGEMFAEDLTFKLLEGSKTTWANVTLEYFRRRRATRKELAITSKRRTWGNALLLVRNCYYEAEMERHQMPDSTGIVKKANEKLLSSMTPVASTAFNYFHQVFLGLSDDITAEDFKKTLEGYLSKFIALAEGTNDYSTDKIRGPTN